jgi:YD repeat-containing protein
MSDRERAGLRGPVKECVEETDFPNDFKFSTTTEYSLDGKLLLSRSTNQYDSEWVNTRAYDADGRLTKVTSGKSGEPATEVLYTYDELGRLLAVSNGAAPGDETRFHYDEHGRKNTIQSFDPKTLQRNENVAFSGSPWDAAEAGFGVFAGGSVISIYDENDRPTEAQIRDAKGNVASRVVRTYNANGQISEERATLENPALMFLDRHPEEGPHLNPAQFEALNKGLGKLLGGQAQAGTLYTYDAQNRVTKIQEHTFIFEKTTTIIYNDQGDRVVEQETFATNSAVPVGQSFSIDDDGNLVPSDPTSKPQAMLEFPKQSEVRYAYQYDSYNNWTEQTASRADTPPSVRRRKITYY